MKILSQIAFFLVWLIFNSPIQAQTSGDDTVLVTYKFRLADGSESEQATEYDEFGSVRKELTDSDVDTYASSKYDKTEMMSKRIILGTYHNAPLVAEFPCGDICPDYTTRVIRYDIALEDCGDVAGIVKTKRITIGRGSFAALICVPEIVAKKSNAE